MKAKIFQSSAGFTLVELMIAMSILSGMLVMGTLIMTRIGSLYSKGINITNLQNSTRNLASDLMSDLQFSSATPQPCTPTATTCYTSSAEPVIHPNPKTFSNGGSTVDVHAYCVGTTRFSYVLNRKQGEDDTVSDPGKRFTPHVLWRDKMSNDATCYPLDLSATGTPPGSGSDGHDVMQDGMRLTRFKAVENPASSGIFVVEVWTAFGDSDLMDVGSDGTASCKTTTGTQFCATSQVTSAAIRRLE